MLRGVVSVAKLNSHYKNMKIITGRALVLPVVVVSFAAMSLHAAELGRWVARDDGGSPAYGNGASCGTKHYSGHDHDEVVVNNGDTGCTIKIYTSANPYTDWPGGFHNTTGGVVNYTDGNANVEWTILNMFYSKVAKIQ